MVADIERLAAELAALSEAQRELVLQRMQVLGTQARDTGHRLSGRGTRTWADLIGERLYNTYGVAVAVVQNIKIKTIEHDDAFKHMRVVQYAQPGRVIEITAYAITRSDM